VAGLVFARKKKKQKSSKETRGRKETFKETKNVAHSQVKDQLEDLRTRGTEKGREGCRKKKKDRHKGDRGPPSTACPRKKESRREEEIGITKA